MEQFNKFIHAKRIRRYKKGEMIQLQGEVAKSLRVIKSGIVKAYDINSDGIEQLIWLGSTGDMFPMSVVFLEDRHTQLFYTAGTDCQTYTVPISALHKLMLEDSRITLYLGEVLSGRLQMLIGRVLAAERPSARQKVIHTLGFLAEQFPDGIPLSQQDLANMLSLTRETVSLELQRLRRRGYIDYSHRLIRVNPDKLEKLEK